MVRRSFACVLVGVLLLTGSASGQQAVRWWTDPGARARLRLTTEQSSALDRIYQSLIPERIENADEVKKLTTQLDTLLQSPTATEGQVNALAARLGAAQARRNVTRTLILFRMRNVLTSKQREELKAMNDEQRRARPTPGGKDF